MNKVFKHFSVLFLILNYYVALCISDFNGYSADLVSNTPGPSSKNYYFLNPKFNLFNHTLKNEKLVNFVNKLPVSFEKRQLYDSLDCKQSKEIFILASFSNYISKERFTFKFFTSTDIIYPFHYFW